VGEKAREREEEEGTACERERKKGSRMMAIVEPGYGEGGSVKVRGIELERERGCVLCVRGTKKARARMRARYWQYRSSDRE